MKSIVPIVMAGVLGIYGLIISVIISTGSALAPPPPSARMCTDAELQHLLRRTSCAVCIFAQLQCACVSVLGPLSDLLSGTNPRAAGNRVQRLAWRTLSGRL